jgi:hypothetical protein
MTKGYSCPLIQQLEKEYGSNQAKKGTIPLRESQDVSAFLKAKRESEKRQYTEKMQFK